MIHILVMCIEVQACKLLGCLYQCSARILNQGELLGGSVYIAIVR